MIYAREFVKELALSIISCDMHGAELHDHV